MVTFLAIGVLVCAFLAVVENIFLVNNKMEILKANIRDYLENLSLPPIKDKVAPEDLKEFANLRGQNKGNIVSVADKVSAKEEIAASDENVEVPLDNDKMLDSFLKEFFS